MNLDELFASVSFDKTRDWRRVLPDVWDDEQDDVEDTRALAAKETAVHAAADAHQQKLAVAMRFAFAMGRRALGHPPNVERAVKAIEAALRKTLPKTLLKIVIDGGEAGLSLLKVKTLGGPGSGNFGHAGRPGEVGGSTSFKDTAEGIDTSTTSARATLSAQTGKPFEAILYRGVDPAESEKVNRTPSQFAVGEYRTPFPEVAKTYGSQVKETPTKLDNPYVFTLGEQAYYDELQQEFGTRNPEMITRQLLAKGHDGLIVKNVPMNRGEISMRDSIEVIVFKKLRTAEPPIKIKFGAKNQAVIDWAERHAAELVTQISETTRDDINNAIAEALESGDFDAAYDEILAAVGDDTRAALIARHETMMAASEGQRQAWDQAVDVGLLTGDEKRTWITVGDEKVCPVCEELDGTTADLDGTYADGIEGPPAHVACRCTEGLTS